MQRVLNLRAFVVARSSDESQVWRHARPTLSLTCRLYSASLRHFTPTLLCCCQSQGLLSFSLCDVSHDFANQLPPLLCGYIKRRHLFHAYPRIQTLVPELDYPLHSNQEDIEVCLLVLFKYILKWFYEMINTFCSGGAKPEAQEMYWFNLFSILRTEMIVTELEAGWWADEESESVLQ